MRDLHSSEPDTFECRSLTWDTQASHPSALVCGKRGNGMIACPPLHFPCCLLNLMRWVCATIAAPLPIAFDCTICCAPVEKGWTRRASSLQQQRTPKTALPAHTAFPRWKLISSRTSHWSLKLRQRRRQRPPQVRHPLPSPPHGTGSIHPSRPRLILPQPFTLPLAAAAVIVARRVGRRFDVNAVAHPVCRVALTASAS